jgi:hypothetical protein
MGVPSCGAVADLNGRFKPLLESSRSVAFPGPPPPPPAYRSLSLEPCSRNAGVTLVVGDVVDEVERGNTEVDMSRWCAVLVMPRG